jgi:uncharacterized protein YoxC
MERLKVFMIMPFQEQFLGLYNMIKDKLGDKYEFSNAGDLDNQQCILQDIVSGIGNADVIIADVTGLNPNVFYELGLCHALNKKVILITQDISELPFDIRSYRVDEYTTDFWKVNEIINKIEKNLQGAKDGSVQFGNPIKDYYPIKKKEELFKEDIVINVNNEISDEVDRGFLDFIADIDDDTNKLTDEINKMQEELNEMTQQIEYGTNEINRVSKSASSGNASFIRSIARKIGNGIQEFSNKMKSHNNKIESIWGRIENNFLDLIDNQYMENESNKLGLIKSLEGLYNMKNSIVTSNIQLETMISTFISVKGVERKLTQSVNSLEEQMRIYLSIMNAANSSIDRIISKSELLVGKIDFESNIEN